MKIRVLFVCAGNICRSPMAEAVFAEMVKARGLTDAIESDSAGTGSWHEGEAADPRTLAVLRRNKIPYAGRARQFRRTDWDEFDYVIAMDDDNLRALRKLGQSDGKVSRMLVEFAPTCGATHVPDPYYGPPSGFDHVYELVTAGCAGLLDEIEARLIEENLFQSS
ncbi:MAG: low molecular weight phosphotyrosine protein phosphatase [Armatimonadetes bacterium]|nr:low molecular weight phosphotyrosine protein phosphatase [Armatimonadota bacterium]